MEALLGMTVIAAYSGGMVILGFILGRRGLVVCSWKNMPSPQVTDKPEGYCHCGHSAVYHDSAGCRELLKPHWYVGTTDCRCAIPREEIAEW